MKKFLALLAGAVFASSVYAAEFPDVSVGEVKKLAETKKAIILDVNGTESYQKAHVPTALNYEKVSGDLAKVLPKDKNALIVAYCGGPKCKAYQSAATAAQKLGYKNIKHMSAGISGWVQAGQKTEKNG
jgi:rhodanese-related sulfurtransferase